MLKIYDKESDIPEGLRSEYKQSGAKWVPDLSEDHPVLTLNKTLKQEKEVEEAKVKKLRGDLDDALEAAKTSGVPRGQTLVSKADGEALNAFKALGKTPDELTAALTEHRTLTEESATRKRSDSLRQLAKDNKYNEEAFIRLPSLPEFVSRPSKDGKTTDWFAQVKDDKGVVTEKPAKEFIESSPDIQPFLSSLRQTDGVRVPTTGPTMQPVAGDQFAWAKQFAEDYSKSSAPTTDLVAAFSARNSA